MPPTVRFMYDGTGCWRKAPQFFIFAFSTLTILQHANPLPTMLAQHILMMPTFMEWGLLRFTTYPKNTICLPVLRGYWGKYCSLSFVSKGYSVWSPPLHPVWSNTSTLISFPRPYSLPWTFLAPVQAYL